MPVVMATGVGTRCISQGLQSMVMPRTDVAQLPDLNKVNFSIQLEQEGRFVQVLFVLVIAAY